ncbi:MAG TPA: hypothetical protein VGM09_16225 [Bradyrhizobium sp.]|jgi:hypothetical protein
MPPALFAAGARYDAQDSRPRFSDRLDWSRFDDLHERPNHIVGLVRINRLSVEEIENLSNPVPVPEIELTCREIGDVRSYWRGNMAAWRASKIEKS